VSQCRIAYLINQYPAVSHTFIRREILALERQGFDILRIAMRGWDAELADEEDQLERAHTLYVLQKGALPLVWAVLRTLLTTPMRFLSALTLTFRMGRWGAKRPLLYHIVYLAEACHILPWVTSFGAIHVHAHFGSNAAEIALLVHALGGPPFSFTFHGEEESLLRGIREKVAHGAFVVAISSYARSQIYRFVDHGLWPKVKVVHCGLEAAFYDVAPMPPSAVPRLICIGRLCKEKAQLLLIEAAHRLAQKGVEFELVIAGDGDMRAAVEEMIVRYQLVRQVRITGWISSNQVREEILAASGLVLTSFAEGLPVVIMEAMALRRPVLASCITGIPELVRPGETGWLFSAGSVDEIVAAIEDFLAKPADELRKMGDAAHLRVLERHSIDTESAKLATLFRQSCQ